MDELPPEDDGILTLPLETKPPEESALVRSFRFELDNPDFRLPFLLEDPAILDKSIEPESARTLDPADDLPDDDDDDELADDEEDDELLDDEEDDELLDDEEEEELEEEDDEPFDEPPVSDDNNDNTSPTVESLFDPDPPFRDPFRVLLDLCVPDVPLFVKPLNAEFLSSLSFLESKLIPESLVPNLI